MNSQIFNIEVITSKSNSTIVKYSKLLSKKSRKEFQLFTLDGVKLFEEAYNFGAEIECIIIKNDAVFDENIIRKIRLLQDEGVKLFCVNENVFLKLTEEHAPQGIITICKFLSNVQTNNIGIEDNCEKIMAFESIRDPGNVGTILRTAAAFGVDRLIFSSDCADIYSQKVLRASMGAIFKLKINIVDNLANSLLSLKNYNKRIISTTLRNNSLQLGKTTINQNDVFIIGNEGHGISSEVISVSDATLFIPMNSNTESLNASIAATILMWEMRKR